MRKIYRVAITEIYRKVVSVPASNEQEAEKRAWDAWANTEIILDTDDFRGAETYVLDSGEYTNEQNGKIQLIENYTGDLKK